MGLRPLPLPLHVFVRFSADLIYERKRGEAASLLLKTAAAAILISFPLGLAFSLVLVRGAPHELLFRLGFAGLLAAVNVLWVAMMTVTVLRRYGLVLASYGLGMGLMYILAALLGPAYGPAGALTALAAGYGLTALLLIAATVLALGLAPSPEAFRRLAGYASRFRNLMVAGAAYAIAAWADKAILWALRGEAAAGTSFYVYPPYDTAFFYANLAIIPGLVFFTLATETDFHLDLMRFLVFLSRRRQPEVEAARVRLRANARASIVAQSFFQGAMSLVLVLLAPSLGAALGFSTLTFCLLVWGGFFQLGLLTALNMLFYLELYRDAALTALSFLLANLALSAATALWPSPFMPLGLSFLASCAISCALGLGFAFSGLERFDRIVYLRASGEEFGH
jgi:uncharacterized membrane protein